MKILNYTISIHKDTDLKAFRLSKIKEYKQRAEEGLINAELTLELQTKLYKKKKSIGYNESEIKGIEDAINNGKKTIANYLTQLEVIENWK